MKIAIGCPVRNRAWILPEYLKRLEEIEWDEKEYIFLVNNTNDGSDLLLFDFRRRNPNTTIVSVNAISNHSGTRKDYGTDGFAYLAMIRNMFLELFMSTESQYLLSIDSDILVPRYTAKALVRGTGMGYRDSPICGAAISNVPNEKLSPQNPVAGNFMMKYGDGYTFPRIWNFGGIHEVDLIGAVYAIPRTAISQGVRYAPHQNGEDIPFCQTAKHLGFRLQVNLDVQCEHVMQEKRVPHLEGLHF